LLLPKLTGVKSSIDPVLIGAMGWFMIAVAALGAILAVLRTPEKIAADDGAHAGLADYWAVIRRPEVLRIMGGDVCIELGPMWMSALYLYFMQAAKGFDAGAASILLFLYVAAGLAGAPLLGWLATRIGKHRAMVVCTTGFSVSLIALFFIPERGFWIAAPVMMVLGAVSIGFTILIRAMAGDIGDQVRLETGKQRIGLLFSLLTLTQKVVSAVSIVLTFRLLPFVGFDTREGAVHSAASIHGLQLIFLIGPIAFVMLGGLFFMGYKLDSAKHAEIRLALEERDAATAQLNL
jgi:GPH family glycoside/pentoside/hexuronide:cation symporter